jgi:hypothetical protein
MLNWHGRLRVDGEDMTPPLVVRLRELRKLRDEHTQVSVAGAGCRVVWVDHRERRACCCAVAGGGGENREADVGQWWGAARCEGVPCLICTVQERWTNAAVQWARLCIAISWGLIGAYHARVPSRDAGRG